jgi:uncharacterized membrane protein YGL010W
MQGSSWNGSKVISLAEAKAIKTDGKLMEMLVEYASAHQQPFNIFIHMVGIPAIMLGVLVPLSWIKFELFGVSILPAQVLLLAFFLFYLSLDFVFAIAFLGAGYLLLFLALQFGTAPGSVGWTIAAVCFFGGYLAQFIGHAVEKSMPVLIRHPIQANLAAPLFTVIELFRMAGFRENLFNELQDEVQERKQSRCL